MDFKNVRVQVTDRLREEVLTGKFKTGESIREIPLAERYNVSRGPIRDALLQLSKEGLLECIPNRGARVGREWDEKLIPIMAEIRFTLESFAIEEVIKNTSEELLPALSKNLKLFKIACEDEEMSSVVQLDLQFHRLFLNLCGHAGLESVWLPLLGGLRLPYSRHKALIESYQEHQMIADAVAQKNLDAAKAALKKNIETPFCL